MTMSTLPFPSHSAAMHKHDMHNECVHAENLSRADPATVPADRVCNSMENY